MSGDRCLVFIDSCAVNRFALLNVDPSKALAGSVFQVAYTPGLEREYRQALVHRAVEPHIKALLGRLLGGGLRHGGDLAPEEDTDAHLVECAKTAFVITLDRKPPWDRASGSSGLILWPDIEAALRLDRTLLDVLLERLPRLRASLAAHCAENDPAA